MKKEKKTKEDFVGNPPLPGYRIPNLLAYYKLTNNLSDLCQSIS